MKLLDLKDAAEYLGVDYKTVREYTVAGLLAVVRLPSLTRRGEPRRKVQIRIDELDRFISANESGPEVGPIDRPEPRKMARNQRPTKSGNVYDLDWRQRVKRSRHAV